jgi:hypothetical protein
VADDPVGDSPEHERFKRGLKFRRREDYAVELFKEAQTSIGDVARVDRILVELGRFYNPYLDAPIVDLATRRAVMEALASGDEAGAQRLLSERLALYTSSENDSRRRDDAGQ